MAVRKAGFLAGAATALVVLAFQPSAYAANEYELKSRLDKLERELQSLRASSASPAGEARLGVHVSELEEENRRLRGLAEQNQYQIDQLRKEVKSLSDDVQYRLQALEVKMPMDGVSVPLPSAGITPSAPAPAPATSAAGRSMEEIVNEVSSSTQPNLPPAAPVVLDKKFSSPQEHYSYAFTLINRAQYDEAEQVLRSFVQRYPKDKLTGNAYYWLGETYYVREKYLDAADAFRQGFEMLPNGTKAPDNLLKLGMSLAKLNKKDQACVVLKQLQVKYKGKAESVLQRAALESQTMGCR